MTEREVQRILFSRALFEKHHDIAIPNTYLYDWESDFISVTRAGYVHEYEIKVTLSDFKADSKKESKHTRLSKSHLCGRGRVPNYFWYVTTFDLDIALVPEYAGLLRTRGGYIYCVKEAPRINGSKITDKQIIDSTRRLSHKLYNEIKRKTPDVSL